ncbi:MAG: type IV pilus biogenesis/stability protein PilW [Xanthomonadales bacterium]|nr:type IV pilus biogenesis/stability protein PilW [Xanthomonadales bacterium]
MRPERTARLAALLLALAAGGCAALGGGKKEASAQGGSAVELHLALAQGYLERGRLDLATDRIQRALALDPRSPAAHTLMALLMERLGNEEKAAEHYRRAAELAPDRGLYQQNYARWLCRSGHHAEAQAHFARALADPLYDQPEIAARNSGLCYRQAGDDRAAAERFREVLRRRPTDPESLFQLAAIHFASGDALRARAFLQRLEAAATLDPEALLLGYRVERMLGDVQAAENYRRRLLETYPDSDQVRMLESEG